MKARQHGWSIEELDAEFDDLDDEELAVSPTVTVSETMNHSVDDAFEYEGLTFLTPADCAVSEPRPYVIKGLLAQRDIACIVGAPGVGKSLMAPRLAYSVALGKSVFDRRVRQAGVFYVAAEDEHGMRGRFRALRDQLGDTDALHLVGGVADLLNTEPVTVKGKVQHRCLQADRLAMAVRDHRPGLIIIDTLAMSFPGLEENSAEGMGRVVAVARRLTKWGAAVILIHHDTKDGRQGLPRGHSLLNGALDVSIHLFKNRQTGVISGTLTKNRNGSCDADLAFRIHTETIGRDADGDEITVATCEPCEFYADERDARLKPSEQSAIQLLREMLAENRQVSLESWKAAAQSDRRITKAQKEDSRRRVVSEALRGLENKGQVKVEGGYIALGTAVDEIDFDDDDQ